MSSSTSPATTVSTGITGGPVTSRVLSLDIFRGFTMAVMIFVNDLSDVRGLPRWTYHYPRDVNAMSYVDMVFPFFLFAAGLSLPLAVRQRLRRDPSVARLSWHILLRCFALVVLGLILANAEKTARGITYLRGSVWATLALLGAVLLWAVYPPQISPRMTRALKGLGALLLVSMLVWFRRVLPNGNLAGGQLAWLDFGYPEILGLIGCTYAAVCALYVPTRNLRWAPLVWFVLLLGFNVACLTHRITPHRFPVFSFPFDNGAMPAIMMAGVVVSGFFLGTATQSRQAAFRQALLMAIVSLALGFFLRPLGISKIRATPTWTLWSVAGATALFAFFYYVLDVRHRTVWSQPFRAPGANTLLTYLLPDLTYYALAYTTLGKGLARWNFGLPGVLRACIFTGIMLAGSALLTRARFRLQL